MPEQTDPNARRLNYYDVMQFEKIRITLNIFLEDESIPPDAYKELQAAADNLEKAAILLAKSAK